MSQPNAPRPGDVSPRERYTHGYGPAVEADMAKRTAQSHAGFFLPVLQAGMSLLDCGCGPGSTTTDLAALLAPGRVVGIDLDPSQVAAARSRAVNRGVTNVAFEVGNIYDLPFPDSSFDAVFGHTVVQHLREPLRALREMRRVLTPGGVIGLRDDDWGSVIIEPLTSPLELAFSLYRRVWAHNGGDPVFARKQRRMLREAGFVNVRASASLESLATPEEIAAGAAYMVEHNQQPAFVQVVLDEGWADQASLEATYADLRAWGRRDDALCVVVYCEAIGWKPDAGGSLDNTV